MVQQEAGEKVTKIVVLGSICYDTIKTKYGIGKDLLGGSAIYAALAASKTGSKVGVLGIAGEDYMRDGYHSIELSAPDVHQGGIEIRPGNTFRWTAEYDASERAHSVDRQFNVMMGTPKFPKEYRDAEYLLLGNHDPQVQMNTLKEFDRSRLKLVMADTMDTYIQKDRKGVETVANFSDVFILNAQEARLLTGCTNVASCGKHLITKFAMKAVIIKCGEHGSMMFTDGCGEEFMCPSLPVRDVSDPTGAGDSMAGGFVGFMEMYKMDYRDTTFMRRALLWGSACASVTIEDFGCRALLHASNKMITDRYAHLRQMLNLYDRGDGI
jgi:sugar/nucleoside kinase (ribokinase family)